MNPMTNVKNIERLNERMLEMGVTDSDSWHKQYKDSAYVFIGGLPYDLTEGDILCVFSQYGEIVNLNLVRDQKTGKTKGFCFLCYEDQRSTILAVDNFNGIKLGGRTIRVDHCSKYRRPKGDEKDEQGNRKEIIEEGCAPRVPSPPPSDDEDEPVQPVKKKKKVKKVKKQKKHKDSRTKEKSSASTSESEEESNARRHKIPTRDGEEEIVKKGNLKIEDRNTHVEWHDRDAKERDPVHDCYPREHEQMREWDRDKPDARSDDYRVRELQRDRREDYDRPVTRDWDRGKSERDLSNSRYEKDQRDRYERPELREGHSQRRREYQDQGERRRYGEDREYGYDKRDVDRREWDKYDRKGRDDYHDDRRHRK